MVRCKETTKSGRRCKLPALVNDTVCTVHACDDMPTLEEIVHDDMPALEEIVHDNVEPTNALVNLAVLKTCTHDFCLLHVNDCCGCSDTRSDDAQYMRFVEGVGDAPIGKREDEYCSNCRHSFASENPILDRFNRFLAIESNEMNKNGLVFTAYLLRDELNNLINRFAEIENSLKERVGNSMNLT